MTKTFLDLSHKKSTPGGFCLKKQNMSGLSPRDLFILHSTKKLVSETISFAKRPHPVSCKSRQTYFLTTFKDNISKIEFIQAIGTY